MEALSLSKKERKNRSPSLTVELIETTCVAGASVRIESVMVSVGAAPRGAGGADIFLFLREAKKRSKRRKRESKVVIEELLFFLLHFHLDPLSSSRGDE